MATTKSVKAFQPGQAYSRQDWDVVDFPEIADEELAHMRPAKEVLPPEFFRAMDEHRRYEAAHRWSIRKSSSHFDWTTKSLPSFAKAARAGKGV